MANLKVLEYVTDQGECPFREWMLGLDRGVRGRVTSRLLRFSMGNFGQNRHLAGGLCEAKLDFGPGYRVYYGIHGQALVILLCGGDKGSRRKDIEQAQKHWTEFLGE